MEHATRPARAGALDDAHAEPLTLAQLQVLFDKPIKDAAKALGVCTTVLKNLCRRLGVQRWPYRQLRSLTTKLELLRGEVAAEMPGSEAYARLQAEIRDVKEKRQQLVDNPNVLVGGERGLWGSRAKRVVVGQTAAPPSSYSMGAQGGMFGFAPAGAAAMYGAAAAGGAGGGAPSMPPGYPGMFGMPPPGMMPPHMMPPHMMAAYGYPPHMMGYGGPPPAMPAAPTTAAAQYSMFQGYPSAFAAGRGGAPVSAASFAPGAYAPQLSIPSMASFGGASAIPPHMPGSTAPTSSTVVTSTMAAVDDASPTSLTSGGGSAAMTMATGPISDSEAHAQLRKRVEEDGRNGKRARLSAEPSGASVMSDHSNNGRSVSTADADDNSVLPVSTPVEASP